MNLTDLETFVGAVQEGSLSAAARRLSVTQPAVSGRLRRLERDLGEPLLRRSGRGVSPTATGTLLYARCLPLLEEIRRLEGELKTEGALRGRLAIGATDLAAIYHLPGPLRALRKRHPALEVAIHVEGTAALLRLLDEGRIEAALVTLPIPGGRFDTTLLWEDPIVLVAGAGHPLAGKRRVPAPALSGEAWINHKRDSVTRQQVEAFFASHGESLRTEMEISSPEAIKALVQARLGIAALPACSVARDLREKRLSVIKVRGFALARASGLAVRRTATPSRALGALQGLLIGARERRRQASR